MDSIKSQLVDMGFTEAKISKAIQSCPEAKTLEQVMEWLIAHDGELDTVGAAGSSLGTTKTSVTPSSDTKDDAQSTQATTAAQSDDFRPEETAVETAARKKITVEEAQKLITERAVIRAEEERKKAIEDEKKRRLDGQKMIQTRAELEDLERIRLAQQIRQDKIDRELHKKRLLEQIALDRENMKNRNKQVVDSVATKVAPTSSSSSNQSPSTNTQPKQPATECRIALRFPDGSTKVQKFSPQEQLSSVRLFVQMEKVPSGQTSNIEFIAPPNKKLTDSMMNETLDSLGLCPASRLEVKFSQSTWIDLD